MTQYLNTNALAENPLVNGSYEFTDAAGASITAAGNFGVVGSLVSLGTSGAGTISQQALAFGQVAVPGDVRNHFRWAQTTAHTAGTPKFAHKIEDVRTFAGKKVTLQGYYRSNVAMPIKMRQDFGAGGSPSADVLTSANAPINSIPSTVDSDGTAQWRPFAMSFTLPSMVGKTIGTTVGTSYLAVDLMPDQLVTFQFDMTMLRLTPAGEANPVVRRRPFAEEQTLCERYFVSLTAFAPVSTQSANWVPFRRNMRIVPTMSGGTGSTLANPTVDGFSIISAAAAAAITGILATAAIAD
jgi:hypothetical protein